MTYSVSTDEIVRKKTVGAFLIFFVLSFNNLVFFKMNWMVCVGIFMFFTLLLLISYLHKPTKYQVKDDGIIIYRPIGNVFINMKDLEGVDTYEHDLLKTSSQGGAFGYYGKLNTDLGKIQCYVTRRNNYVVLTKRGRMYIALTPDLPEEFVNDVVSKATSQAFCKAE